MRASWLIDPIPACIRIAEGVEGPRLRPDARHSLRSAQSLWRAQKLPFEIQFFHLGGIFDQPVRIYEVVGKEVSEITFDPAAFNYGRNKIDRAQLGKLGFAGFRVHFPLKRCPSAPGYKDELVSFLGASYFRALGQGQRYGASARGLAIDTAERSGEEFPRFEQFWIERPARGIPPTRDLRVAGFAASDRRVSLHDSSRRRDGDRCAVAAVFARAGGQACDGALDVDVLSSARTSAHRPRTIVPRCMTRMVLRSSQPVASGSGARWSIRADCW